MTARQLEHVDACWLRGNGIAETRLAVMRNTGTKPTFEQVRRRFARLSNSWQTL